MVARKNKRCARDVCAVHLETQSFIAIHNSTPSLEFPLFHLGEPMIMTMRWYRPTDLVPLRHIRQVLGVTGIVGALYDVPLGEVWGFEKLQTLRQQVEANGLKLEVIESIPIPEPIKIGLPERPTLVYFWLATDCG